MSGSRSHSSSWTATQPLRGPVTLVPPDCPIRGRNFCTARSTAPVSSVCTWIEPNVGPVGRSRRFSSDATGAASVSSTGSKPQRS